MDPKLLDLRPDWTKDEYHRDYKIDLSTNVCWDAGLPHFEFDYSRYSNTATCYKILSDYHGVYTKQLAIGLGLSELIMRVMQVIKDRNWTLTNLSSWKPVSMAQRLYGIPHGQDVCYISNPHGENGKLIEDYKPYIDQYKLVIIDEAYGDFCETPSVNLGSSNVLYLKTMSKSLAMPGIRFGWAVGHEPLIFEIQNSRPAHVCIGGLAENLPAMLDEIPHHVKRMNATKAYIEKTYTCIPSQANYVLIKGYEKFSKHFHLKEFEGHARMALINRNMVTKSALNKEHPFFDRVESN